MQIVQLTRSILLSVLLLSSTASFASPASGAPLKKVVTPSPDRWWNLASTVIRNVGAEQGLTSPAVTTITEDSVGYLWLGTDNGLARWDGYRFRYYQYDVNDPSSIPSNFISKIHTDKLGQLWIGTSDGGLARYEPESDKFIRIKISSKEFDTSFIQAFADDKTDGLWIGTEEGLYYFSYATQKISRYLPSANNADGLLSDDIHALLIDKHGVLWVGSGKGVARLEPADKATHQFHNVRLPLADSLTSKVTALLQTSDGDVWIGCSCGLFKSATQGTSIRLIDDPTIAHFNQEKNWDIFSIVETDDGEIWIGNSQFGIYAAKLKEPHFRRIQHDPLQPDSLSQDHILCVVRGRGGLIWIGTERGLGRYDAQQSAILTLSGGKNNTALPVGADYYGLLEMGDSILSAVGENGLSVLDPNNAGQLQPQHRPAASKSDSTLNSIGQFGFDKANKLPSEVCSLSDGPDGSVYLGTSLGLFLIDQSNPAPMRFQWNAALQNKPACYTYLDGDKLWLATLYDGLWLINLHSKDAATQIKIIDSRLSEDISTHVIEPAGKDALWLGARSGLYLLNRQSGVAEHVPLRDEKSLSPFVDIVFTLLTDHLGRLWVGSQGTGISVQLNPSAAGKSLFLNLGKKEGLLNLNINKLLEDDDGNIWASTDDGLAVIDSKTFEIQMVQRAAGVEIQSYLVTSGTKTKYGELIFGGLNGFTVVRPDRYKKSRDPAPLIITDIRVNNVTLNPNNYNYASAKKNELIIAPDSNNFTIEFASLDFVAPEKNRYAYRLEGFEKKWNYTDANHRFATYTNLAPGDYRLLIRGTNHDQIWSENVKEIKIHVVPLWNQTWWFLLACVLIALLAIYLVAQLRNFYLIRKRNELEQLVRQRTHELTETQRTLVQTARKAGMAEIATNVLHNVGNVLTSINVSANLLIGKAHSSASFKLTRATQLMDDHAADLSTFIRDDERGKILPVYLKELAGMLQKEQQDMLGELKHLSASVEHVKEIVAQQQSYSGASSMVEPVQILGLVNEALRMCDAPLRNGNVELVKEIADLPDLELDKHRLLLILINLITNAAESLSQRGLEPALLTIRAFSPTPQVLRITVTDTGLGIASDNLIKIFSHGFTTKENGNGFGLHSSIIAAGEMGATLTVRSDGPELGAEFCLDLPISTATANADKP